MSNITHIYELGIPVAGIAINGQYNISENMQYTNGLGPEDFDTFTVCLRFYVEYLRPEYTIILSYSTFKSDNTIGVWLVLESDGELKFGFCKYWGLSLAASFCNYVPVSFKIQNKWHHACWLVKTDSTNSNPVKVSTKIFFDGKEGYQGNLSNLNFYS